MTDDSKYPELEKMRSVRGESRLLTEFVDWLEDHNMRICVRTASQSVYSSPYEPIPENYEKLFARFFAIDLEKVEDERRAMLEALREDHQ